MDVWLCVICENQSFSWGANTGFTHTWPKYTDIPPESFVHFFSIPTTLLHPVWLCCVTVRICENIWTEKYAKLFSVLFVVYFWNILTYIYTCIRSKSIYGKSTEPKAYQISINPLVSNKPHAQFSLGHKARSLLIFHWTFATTFLLTQTFWNRKQSVHLRDKKWIKPIQNGGESREKVKLKLTVKFIWFGFNRFYFDIFRTKFDLDVNPIETDAHLRIRQMSLDLSSPNHIPLNVRIAEFSEDPQNMDEMSAFIDDILNKAQIEVDARLEEKNKVSSLSSK